MNANQPVNTREPYRIDVHHHVLPRFFFETLEKAGITTTLGMLMSDWSLDAHLEVMDRNKVAVGMASIPAGFYFESDAFARDLARQCNEYLASMRSENPNRFGAFASLPLPFWLWITFGNRRPPDASLALAFAASAWGMVALSHFLARQDKAYRLPWHVTGICVNLAAPVIAHSVAPRGFAPALCLLSTGLLFFADAIVGRRSINLAPGGVATAWGLDLLLDRLHVSINVHDFALASLAALYLLAGLWTERRKSRIFTHKFLLHLYLTAHALTLYVLARIYLHPFESLITGTPWADVSRLWGSE